MFTRSLRAAAAALSTTPFMTSIANNVPALGLAITAFSLAAVTVTYL